MATVDQIQENSSSYARDLANQGQQFINNLAQLASNAPTVTVPEPALGLVSPEHAATLAARAALLTPTAPTLPDFTAIPPPGAPRLDPFSTISVDNIPEFLAVEPVLNLPARPDATLPGAPTNAPEFNAPALPARPNVVLPPAPTFAPVAVPELSNVELPLFDMQMDFPDLAAPTQVFQYDEREYESALLDETKKKLLDDMVNGGYGIDPDDERRLWDRARERELLNANARLEELSRLHAARGFALPPGSLYAQQEAAQQELLEKNSSLSRDIALKRADLYVDNRKFTIQSALQLENMLINYYGAMAERALNAARLQVEMGIALYNAQVERFKTRLESYRTYAAVFESRVRSALASVELYKAQVEGARLTVETQKLHAEVYQTQIDGVSALINLYRNEMEAAQIAAQIEQIKLNAFRTQVEAYGEQVRAKAAEFGMFEAGVRGETARVQAYQASVQAYAARVGGLEAKARAQEVRARTEIAQATAKLDIYKTDMERYRTDISKVAEQIRGMLGLYQGLVQSYNTQLGGFEKAAEIGARTDEANARVWAEYFRLVGEKVRIELEALIKQADQRIGASKDGANILLGLAQSWVQGVTGITAQIDSGS